MKRLSSSFFTLAFLIATSSSGWANPSKGSSFVTSPGRVLNTSRIVAPKQIGRTVGTGWITNIVGVQLGNGSGHNAQSPLVIKGRPNGAGLYAGDVDSVISLGKGGQITVQTGIAGREKVAVYENGFRYASGATLTGKQLKKLEKKVRVALASHARANNLSMPNWTMPSVGVASPTPALIEGSSDGQSWYRIGVAGFQPTVINKKNTQSIRAGAIAGGGDRFSLKNAIDPIPAGTSLKFFRVTDLGLDTQAITGQKNSGFDLAGLHVSN